MPVASADGPQVHSAGRYRAREGDAVETIHIDSQFVAKLQHLLHFFKTFVLARGFFEVHFLTEAVARVRNRAKQRVAPRAQELGDALHLMRVFGESHHLLARPQTHAHFTVDASRMIGCRKQVFLTAAHLKQVQKLAFEPFRGCARAEGAEVNGVGASQMGSDLRTRKFIRKKYLEVWRHAQPQHFKIPIGKKPPRHFVMNSTGFEP
ncbi:MAG: hypothetical protein C5B51_21285 [Terriglobia bacterium]|nr:MAG: hypothetical protein C5B51_21285 [Terriglobia bacterium]